MLSQAQKQIVETTANKVVVIASAAAGKTNTLVERVKYLLAQNVNPTEIVLITFTNAAAEELSERLGQPKGMFIGTIHSYANYLLLSNGRDTSELLEKEEFDKLFPLIKRHPECIHHVSHLLLDESQDSNLMQFEFLLDMVKPDNYMLMGDHRQSIYRWNGAYPDYIINLMHSSDVTTYKLTENYRNGSHILDYAKNIIITAGYEYYDEARAMRNTTGKVIDVEYNPSTLARAILKYGNYGSWFVLTRTNDQVDEMIHALKSEGIPCSSFKRSQLTNKELYKEMKNDSVKVLTIHTSKGLEADNVIVVGAKFYNLEEKCISYVAATRARNLLVWTRMPTRTKKMMQVTNWEK